MLEVASLRHDDVTGIFSNDLKRVNMGPVFPHTSTPTENPL
jgi:hypothetical protein